MTSFISGAVAQLAPPMTGALRMPLPRSGPRLPFDIPIPAPPRLPMPPPRPLPVPPPEVVPRPLPSPRPVPQPLPLPGTKPEALPKADAPASTRDRTREAERECKTQKKDCVKCPPEDGHMYVPVNGKGHSMSDLSSRYQNWVTNFPFPWEWLWSATDWDGFVKSRCTLQEAKANYKFMLIFGFKHPKFAKSLEKDLIVKAFTQAGKAKPSPPVRLEWHFLQREVYEYCSERYEEGGLTNLTAYWNPMPGTKDHEEYEEVRREEQKALEEYKKQHPDIIA
ncbi:Tox-REase-5 domain-containing protein [Pseudomonas chlororaphis]|uniref:Tox-REase-5 domain-containing protein n=2 Tax=Pseudomonas TaxID=286 RepID=UPI0023688AA3|nr:Tox-REase-5 domain-containing protein [Pseudomonas chlororaphis]WDH33064.1 Tox-REase-5 domain-containing protein [Pseudomonas chlororaphis]WDH39148.1 Tox-REase-5 domain-containing protein [Pseudomonas chlororaphis]